MNSLFTLMLGSCSTCAGWLILAVFVGGAYLLLKNDLGREREGRKRRFEYVVEEGLALFGLGLFLTFAAYCVMLFSHPSAVCDVIYGDDFPYSSVWVVEMIIVSFGVIWPWPQKAPQEPDLGRDAFCLMTVLLLSLLLHIHVAWLYFGHGMAVPACYRGFADRLTQVGVCIFIPLIPMCLMSLCGLYANSHVTRQLFAPRGLTGGSYFMSSLRRLLYCGAVGLLVYEIELCAWFA